ncbi:sulfurtransferase TusA family protein [Haloarcula sp. S1AR25-5A]|uniref:Sulfurtransferase TusA family protein n=1 Tax=Haloarcula terrestris TaxID=2950533 RepID=A0AAE4EYT7_9EURY|nr:sulfurtransferase TusA family protein [Haloarcula terrestris]MDS0222805.1 sulfurtransferase TusA family protein [Haloarcula terrestris]
MHRVDVRGEICPRPALIVRQALSDLDTGETLVVRGDYPPAAENLRRMCTTHGIDVTTTETSSETDEFELELRVTEMASLSEA